MFQVKVTNSMFIAHSLPDESFGPAQNLHGATYTIDLFISSNTLTDKNIVTVSYTHLTLPTTPYV